MKPIKPMAGKAFGRLLVIEQVGINKRGSASWSCKCSCGNIVSIDGASLRRKSGMTKSCGCIRLEAVTTHGQTRNKILPPEYSLWYSAKYRARKYGREFSITVEDIHIPKICPILQIPITPNTGKLCDNSPSLDRVDSGRGYTPDNIAVISFKANSIKRNATPQELTMVANYMNRQSNA